MGVHDRLKKRQDLFYVILMLLNLPFTNFQGDEKWSTIYLIDPPPPLSFHTSWSIFIHLIMSLWIWTGKLLSKPEILCTNLKTLCSKNLVLRPLTCMFVKFPIILATTRFFPSGFLDKISISSYQIRKKKLLRFCINKNDKWHILINLKKQNRHQILISRKSERIT